MSMNPKRHVYHVIDRVRILLRQHYGSLIFLLFAALLLIVFSLWVEEEGDEEGPHGCWHYLTTNPGSVFALFTGIITIFGFWFTIEGLQEIRSGIHSFEEMLSRVCELIEETKEDDCVKILSKTPATGCLALKSNVWEQLPNILQERKKMLRCRVKIICLGHEEMEKWYSNYRNKTPETIKKATIDTFEILDTFGGWSESLEHAKKSQNARQAISNSNNADDTSILNGLDEAVNKCERKLAKFLRWDEMPGYYIFCNSKRAIFALPLNMPSLTAARQPEASGTTAEDGDIRPEMIGFESSQFAVTDVANQTFDYYWAFKTNLHTITKSTR